MCPTAGLWLWLATWRTVVTEQDGDVLAKSSMFQVQCEAETMLDLTERFGVLRWDDSSGMVVQWNGTCSNLWSPNQQIWNTTLRGKEWFDSLHEVTLEQVYYKTGSPGLHHSDTVRALRKQASSGATLEQTQQTPDPVYEIQKVAYENLTFKEFHDFRVQDRPLVITGVPREHRTCFGGLRDYSDLRFRDCNGSVHVNVITDGEGQRKGSRVVGTMPFQEFLEFFSTPGGLESRFGTKGPFGGTFVQQDDPENDSIRKLCPKSWRDLRLPAYFTGQMGLHSGTGIIIYFSQRGFRHTFHVDLPRTEFWGSICRGRKRYRVVPFSIAVPGLVPEAESSTATLRALKMRLLRDAEGVPLGVPIWEGVLEAGEVLYMPAGAVHSVDAPEDTVNFLANFIDIGGLGPLSDINIRLLEDQAPDLAALLRNQSQLSMQERRRTWPVHDALGPVEDPASVARGFPRWGDLVG